MSRLSKEERERIIAEIESGVENPDYVIRINKLGKCLCQRHPKKRVRKTVQSDDSAVEPVSVAPDVPPPKDKSWLDAIQYYNLGNTLTMMNHSLQNLNERVDKYKAKTSKLKGKYKKLKRAIYEDDTDYVRSVDNERDTASRLRTESEIESVSEPVENTSEERVSDENRPVRPSVDRPQNTKHNRYGWYFQ